MSSVLESVREAIAARLQERREFSAVPVLTLSRGDVLGEIERKIKELQSVAVVSILSAVPEQWQTTRPVFQAEFSIDLIENILLTRRVDSLTAWALAEAAAAACHMWTAPSGDLIQMSRDALRELPTDEASSRLLIVRATFTAKISTQPRSTTN